jgi:hypothetical protein
VMTPRVNPRPGLGHSRVGSSPVITLARCRFGVAAALRILTHSVAAVATRDGAYDDR